MNQIFKEVAFIAYYFHWTPDQILQLEHNDRRRWVEEISRINELLNTPEETSI